MKTKKRLCENCKFYLEHYVKTSFGYQSTMGHCICRDLNDKRAKNKYSLKSNCEYWQPIEIQKAERKERLIENLRRLTKELEAVCEVLLDDNN